MRKGQSLHRTANRFLLIALLALSALHAHSGKIYKHINEDGSVTYSAEPNETGKEVELKEPNSISAPPPRKKPASKENSPDPKGEEESEGEGEEHQETPKVEIVPYLNLEIIDPKDEQVLQNMPMPITMTVACRSVPSLQPGHIYRFYHNGQSFTDSTVCGAPKQELYRGEHRFRVTIIDQETKQELISSAAVSIHIKQHSRLLPLNKKKKAP